METRNLKRSEISCVIVCQNWEIKKWGNLPQEKKSYIPSPFSVSDFQI
jgi:hypothetical protein